jgi:hypothetical protein
MAIEWSKLAINAGVCTIFLYKYNIVKEEVEARQPLHLKPLRSKT